MKTSLIEKICIKSILVCSMFLFVSLAHAKIIKHPDQAKHIIYDGFYKLGKNVKVRDIIKVGKFSYKVVNGDTFDLITKGKLKLLVQANIEPLITSLNKSAFNVMAFDDIGRNISKSKKSPKYKNASAAFKKVFSKLRKRGGQVFIPIGVYPVSEAIIMENKTRLYLEQDGKKGARIIHTKGTVDNIIRNANATSAFKKVIDEIAKNTKFTKSNTKEKQVISIYSKYLKRYHRYVVLPDSANYTNIKTKDGVKLKPALDKFIRIIGVGPTKGTYYNATLKQNGRYNRLEKMLDPYGRTITTPRWRWIGVLLENVDNVRVSQIRIQDTVRFGISCQSGCFNAKFHKLRFAQPAERLVFDINGNPIKDKDGNKIHKGIPNQDCINIRHMSRHIYIAYIYGTCGDDVIALTGLEKTWTSGGHHKKVTQINMNVAYHQSKSKHYQSRDIYDVEIKKIYADPIGSHHVVRLLGSDDVAVHKIDIKDIENNTTWKELEGNVYNNRKSIDAAVLIGSARYGESPHKDASFMHNITINNVKSSARNVIKFAWSAKDVEINNISSTWRKKVKYKGDFYETNEGEEPNLIRFALEAATGKYDAAPKGKMTFDNINVNGALLVSDGGKLNKHGNPKYGTAVFIGEGIKLNNSTFSNIYIRKAHYAVYIEVDAILDNVIFNNFRIRELVSRPFMVKSQKQSNWKENNFKYLYK